MNSIHDVSVRKGHGLALIALASSLCLGTGDNHALAGASIDERSAKPVTTAPPAQRIDKAAAAALALKKVPGEVTAVDIERKRGRNVYVVEVIEAAGGKETDVFIDPITGDVVGTE